MKTHRTLTSILVIVLMAMATPNFANVNEPVAVTSETPDQTLDRLHRRLEEIKGMDRNDMSRTERKALKKEVRQIKDEVKQLSGGVYISIGAILILILLLIILL